jgi:hypothetical protein
MLQYSNAVGTETGYRLDGRGFGVRVLAEASFSRLPVIQTSSGAHPASYPLGTGGFFPRGKAAST